MSAYQIIGSGMVENLTQVIGLVMDRITVVTRKLAALPDHATPYQRAELIQEIDCLTRLVRVLRDPTLEKDYLK